jgi:hypothetical protein
MGEHESTVSRNLERTRRDLRGYVERELRRTHRMSADQVQLCFEHAASDSPFKLSAAIAPREAEIVTQKKQGGSF